jgi:cardiolipin synthase
MLNAANLITLVRLALVPLMGWCVVSGRYAAAAAVFLIAALSDLADGYIARRFGMVSRLGGLLDPVADKLNMFVATLVLASKDLVPVWLAAAIIARDVAIVAGVVAYRMRGKSLAMKPTWLSKFNTFVEFGVLALVFASAAGWVDIDRWLPLSFRIVLVTVIASAAHYAWLWKSGRLAMHRS